MSLEVVDPCYIAQILHVELQHANNKGIWGVMHLLMFNKKQQQFDSSTFITSNLKNWRDEGVASLWKEIVEAYASMSNISKGKRGNITRALSLAHEAHYGKAIQLLKSIGVVSQIMAAILDIVNRHP